MWSVAVQTCPRDKVEYLSHTITSIKRAGWDDFTIFAEPNSPVDHNKVVFRPNKYGDWSNWICALFEIYATQPYEKYYLIFEDDITLPKNLKHYLEWVIPTLGEFGCLSLYTPPKHKRGIESWHDESDAGWELHGAQAILFTNSSIRRFISHPKILFYRYDNIGLKNAHKDCAIGKWAKDNERVLYHTPSLMDHCGEFSTIGCSKHKSDNYVGDDFDCRLLIGKTIPTLDIKTKPFHL